MRKENKTSINMTAMDTTKDNWWGFLVTLMLLALIVFGSYCLKTGKSLEGIGIITGVLIGKLGTMIDFRYGSSKGSKEKDGSMSQLLNESIKNEKSA